jgi:hypothetical protein
MFKLSFTLFVRKAGIGFVSATEYYDMTKAISFTRFSADMFTSSRQSVQQTSLLACKFFTCNEHEDVDIEGEPPGSCKAFPNDGWEASSSGHQCKPFQGMPEMFKQ